jgi:hypothetical protein
MHGSSRHRPLASHSPTPTQPMGRENATRHQVPSYRHHPWIESRLREKKRRIATFHLLWPAQKKEKKNNNRGKQPQSCALARIAKLTACVPFFSEFELVCHRYFESMRTPRRGRRWPSVRAVRAEDSFVVPFILLFFFRPFSVCLRNGYIRVHFLNICLASPLRPDLFPLCHPQTPQWSLGISLRNSDMIPVLRKAQFKGPCGRLLLEQSQIVPIDSGESPPFSLTSPLNFMRPR